MVIGLLAAASEGQQLSVEVGDVVQVVDAAAQRQRLIGPARFPARTGTVVSENPLGRSGADRLFYVRLEATRRARERTATFWNYHLLVIQRPQ